MSKFLKNNKTGVVFPYTPALAKLPEMEECGAPNEKAKIQEHMTVQQKRDNGIPLTDEDYEAYPNFRAEDQRAAIQKAVKEQLNGEDQNGDQVVDLDEMTLEGLLDIAGAHQVDLSDAGDDRELIIKAITAHFDPVESAEGEGGAE